MWPSAPLQVIDSEHIIVYPQFTAKHFKISIKPSDGTTSDMTYSSVTVIYNSHCCIQLGIVFNEKICSIVHHSNAIALNI